MLRSILAAVLLLSLPACALLEGGLEPPADLFVEATRANFDQVAPRFLVYLAEDPDLSPLLRTFLEALVADWDLLIRAAEGEGGGE